MIAAAVCEKVTYRRRRQSREETLESCADATRRRHGGKSRRFWFVFRFLCSCRPLLQAPSRPCWPGEAPQPRAPRGPKAEKCKRVPGGRRGGGGASGFPPRAPSFQEFSLKKGRKSEGPKEGRGTHAAHPRVEEKTPLTVSGCRRVATVTVAAIPAACRGRNG